MEDSIFYVINAIYQIENFKLHFSFSILSYFCNDETNTTLCNWSQWPNQSIENVYCVPSLALIWYITEYDMDQSKTCHLTCYKPYTVCSFSIPSHCLLSYCCILSVILILFINIYIELTVDFKISHNSPVQDYHVICKVCLF